MYYQGRPLIERVLERVKPQVKSILISANRHLQHYQRFGCPVLEDQLPDYQGPLAGLCRGSAYAQTPWLLLVPCDGPLLPIDLAQRLARAAEREGSLIALAWDGNRTHFTFALIATSLVEDLNKVFAEGQRKLGVWQQSHRPAIADFSDLPHAFANLNQISDFKEQCVGIIKK